MICSRIGTKMKSVVALLVFINISRFVNALTEEEQNLLEFDAPDEIKETLPYYLSGYDAAGAPVWIFEMGRWDVRKIVEMGPEMYNELEKRASQMFLRFRESGRNNTSVSEGERTGFIAIADLDGYALRQFSHPPTLKFVLDQFSKLERTVKSGDLKMGVIVNANFIFQRLWDLAKGLIGELASAVEVYGNNPEKWKPQLLKSIPQDQLPEFYGGEKEHKFVAVYGGR